MKIEELANRIEELTKLISESVDNHNRIKSALDNSTNYHNSLLGRLDELKAFHKRMEEQKELSEFADVVEKL